MTPADSSTGPAPEGHRVAFEALDGLPLSGAWYVHPSSASPRAVVVVAPGGGIRAASYRRLARHLACEGAAVLCFDFRGIGASRRGSLRGVEANMAVWGRDDLGGALAHAASRHPSATLGLVCHSIAGAMAGMARNAGDIRRLVLLAPHTAYFGDYLARWRAPMFLAWHVLMPAATRVAGYFPGRALRLGSDLPKGFALEWAGRLHREVGATAADRARWDALRPGYAKVTADTLAISVTDDAFAPPPAAGGALALYPSINAVHRVVSPGDLGVPRLGHMAFLRERTGAWFWQQAAAWLLQREARVDYASKSIPA